MGVRGDLIKLAAEMLEGKGMPSKHYEDWDWPQHMPKKAWGKVLDAAYATRGQCLEWGIKVRELADKLERGE
jgi:hypothetical protein